MNPLHLAFVALIALIVLGPKRLPDLARSLGHGMREFREALNFESRSDSEPLPAETASEPSPPTPPASEPAPAASVAGAETVTPPAEGSPTATPPAEAPPAAGVFGPTTGPPPASVPPADSPALHEPGSKDSAA